MFPKIEKMKEELFIISFIMTCNIILLYIATQIVKSNSSAFNVKRGEDHLVVVIDTS